LCEKSEKPVLILIRNIEHGEELNRLIPDSVFLSGRDDTNLRDSTFKKYENKEIPVLIGTMGILSEGISINAIRTLIIAQGGKSEIVAAQSLGRALRRDGDDKQKAIVYEFFDIGNKYTEKHSLQRAKVYKDVGFPVNIEKGKS
jgi:superfamily II DNA or RNA helicase